MFKTLFRHITITLLAFYLTSVYVVSGFELPLSLSVYVKAVIIFSLISFFLKPILKLLLLPINLLTLGLFGWIVNVILLYFLKLFVPEVHFGITFFPGFSWEGIVVPQMTLTPLWTVIATSFSLTFLTRLLNWLIGK